MIIHYHRIVERCSRLNRQAPSPSTFRGGRCHRRQSVAVGLPPLTPRPPTSARPGPHSIHSASTRSSTTAGPLEVHMPTTPCARDLSSLSPHPSPHVRSTAARPHFHEVTTRSPHEFRGPYPTLRAEQAVARDRRAFAQRSQLRPHNLLRHHAEAGARIDVARRARLGRTPRCLRPRGNQGSPAQC